jgi:DNA end-binding protein Ku
VRAPKLGFEDDDISVRPQELAMAESYIAALSGDFEPDEFSDDYREALQEVIDAKVAGREVTQPAEPAAASGQVVDLMEALRRSVAEAKARRGEPADAADKPAKKTAKKAAKADEKKPVAKTSAKKTASKEKKPAKKAAAKATSSSARRTTKKTAAKKSA